MNLGMRSVCSLVLAGGWLMCARADQEWPKTVPAASGSPDEAVLFAVVGDNRPGGGSDTQPAVYHEILDRLNDTNLAFVVNTGDIILGSPKDAWDRQLEDFLRSTATLNAPMYVAYGNHELRDAASLITLEKRVGPRYFAFTRGPARFYFLNTYLPGQTHTVEGEQLEWLRKDLETEGSKVLRRFVFLHAPLYSPRRDAHSSWADEDNKRELHGLFVRHRVDAVICGHDHFFAWRQVDGVDYIVSGGGGAPKYETPGALAQNHFLLVRAAREGVSIEMVPVGDAKAPAKGEGKGKGKDDAKASAH